MIKKPSRKTSGKFYGFVAYSFFIFGLILIPVISLIPKEIREKIFLRTYKKIGGKIWRS